MTEPAHQNGADLAQILPSWRDDLLWLLLPGFALLGLYGYGRWLPDAAVIACWLCFTLVIASGQFLRLRIRRRAWLMAYVAPASRLQRWLRGGALALLIRACLAAVLAAALIIGVLRLRDSTTLLLLLAFLPVMATVRWSAGYALRTHVSRHFLPESALRVTLVLSFVLLCAALLAGAWWRPGPDFSAMSLDQAAWSMALQEQANSAILEQALAMAAALDGVRWWLAQHGLPRLQWPLLELLGWLMVLMESAVFVWAWLHGCVGVMLMRTLWKRTDAASDALPTS